MKRTNVNFLIDLAAFVEVAFLASTGLLVRYVLPPGSGRMATVWGLDRHGWGGVHFWIAAAFGATLLVHLALHWKWIVCTVKGARSRYPAERKLAGAIACAVIVVAAALPLLAPVERSPGGPAEHDQYAAAPAAEAPPAEHDDAGIRGSMTLADVAQLTGVQLTELKRRLGLADSVGPDEQLGRLRRQYGFQMQDVRDIATGQPPH
ncbi:hypothetical protein Pla123a_36110 [Posidoniimonas polymericola]|uniref:Flavinylation-associated cytochrome domain-containing protein n=1 Tax=Posidoniimonas polymericola TaxID=2528002 RepID=A0A5C5YFD5_9BACT|nr:DUF4405 domain-containing protein [Posidoniimonas polymericola]TWT73718.1 hypothetical protein Pla123a_36110 [Posidoniimonas polymericola]